MRVLRLQDTDLPLRIAIVSDTHGAPDPRIVSQVRRCDFAVHAGDVGGSAALTDLRPQRAPLVAVRGNNDVPEKWPAAERDVLETLPEQAELVLPGGTLVVVHGHRAGPPRTRHAQLRRRFGAAAAVVYGHSHVQTLDCEQRPWILNPGAAGAVRTRGGPSCLILQIEPSGWQVNALRFPPAPRAPRR